MSKIKVSNTQKRLQQLMESRGVRQVDILNLTLALCEQYNVKFNKSDISQYLSGKAEPNQDKLFILSEALDVNVVWLMGYDVPMEKTPPPSDADFSAWDEKYNTDGRLAWEVQLFEKGVIKPLHRQQVPFLGTIAAGVPILADEEFESYVEVGASIVCDFCLRVKGDSMINVRINDGDIVFIKRQSDVEDGEIAAVLIDDEATLKRIYKGNGFVKLVAENPKFKVTTLTEQDCLNVIILGKAVAFQSDII